MWKWLFDSKHGIDSNDKFYLLQQFSNLVYAETEEEFSERLKVMKNDIIVEKYQHFQDHLMYHIFPKMQYWSLAYRILSSLPISGRSTNNLLEFQLDNPNGSTFKYFLFEIQPHKMHISGIRS